MTLKQFLELMAGVLLAYITFVSNLFAIFKWPLALLFALAGVAAAFIPLEERPLDQWLINFIKSIYHPTRFIWKRTGIPPRIFEKITKKSRSEPATKSTHKGKTTPQPLTLLKADKEQVDQKEQEKISHINALLSQASTPLSKSPHTTTAPNKPSVSIRKLKPPTQGVVFIPARPQSIPTNNSPIPHAPPVKIETTPTPPTQPLTQEKTVIFNKPTITKEKLDANITKATQTTSPSPLTPKNPNIVVGMVVNSSGSLVEGAIVEIIDESGTPQRAVKTNQLGQFSISTPLRNGTYIIGVEKEGLTIPQKKIVISGDIIQPLSLLASS